MTVLAERPWWMLRGGTGDGSSFKISPWSRTRGGEGERDEQR